MTNALLLVDEWNQDKVVMTSDTPAAMKRALMMGGMGDGRITAMTPHGSWTTNAAVPPCRRRAAGQQWFCSGFDTEPTAVRAATAPRIAGK